MTRYIALLLFLCLNAKLTCSIKPMIFRRKSPPKSVGVEMRGGASKTATITDNRMPSLFGPEDAQYDRYAACLAATEGLRRLRDKELEEGSSSESLFDDSLQVTKQVNARYVQNAGKVLKALGMSVSQFNTLGRQISQDSRLKEKVSNGDFDAKPRFPTFSGFTSFLLSTIRSKLLGYGTSISISHGGNIEYGSYASDR